MANQKKIAIEDAPVALLGALDDALNLVKTRGMVRIRWNDGAPVLPITALKIVDRFGKLVNFTPNDIQVEFMEKHGIDPDCPALTMPRGLTEVILKERQTGMTTLIAALYFLDTIGNLNRRTGVITHREETSKEVFQMYLRFHRNLVKDFPELSDVLELDYSTKSDLTYKNLGSWIKIGWANQTDIFSGFTIHNLHWSEAAKYTCNVEQLVASVLGSTNKSFVIQIYESTAKGRGNFFHELWGKAREGEGGRHATFLAWPKSGKNKIPIADDEELPMPAYLKEPGALEYEQKVVEEWNLDRASINWWRLTKDEFGVLFEQEYPLTEVEAFIAGDDPYIPREILRSLAMEVDSVRPIHIDREYGGEFRVYERPMPGNHYTIGVDTATGETNEEDKADFSAAVVFNRTTRTIAAVYRARPFVNDYADFLYRIARQYNNAVLVPERNTVGIVLIQLLREDYRYPNFYRTKTRDTGGGGHQLAWGFHTSKTTKRLLIDEFVRGMQERDIWPLDQGIVAELSVFENVDGKLQAKQGHDDLVIATALAYYGAVEGPGPAARREMLDYTGNSKQDRGEYLREGRHTPQHQIFRPSLSDPR